MVDPIGDFEHSSGQEPGFTPDHIDITSAWAMTLDPGPVDLFRPTDANQVWAPTGIREVTPPNAERFFTFTGDQVHDGSQYEQGALLFGFTLADTPPADPPGRCEYVVWVNDLARGPAFINNPNFPQDPAGGTNLAFGLGLNPSGGPGLQSAFALQLQDGGGFAPIFEADVRAFITPEYVGITVPRTLIGEIAALNFYSFCAEEDFGFEAGVSGADQTGLADVTFDDFGAVALASIELSETTTTTEPATTTTQLIETTTTAGAPAETPDDASPGFPWWFVLMAGGLGMAAAGWWLYSRGDDPCRELFEEWMSAAERCEQARRAADEAAVDCETAELELAGLEDERKEICKTWPPACWETEDGDWIEDERGNRITSRDIHMRKVALGEAWADYRSGKLTAGEVEARWREIDTPAFRAEIRDTDAAFADLLQAVDDDIAKADQRLDQACDRADRALQEADEACKTSEEARKAYEQCAGTDSSMDGPQTAEPRQGRPGEREARLAGEPEKTLVFVDFSFDSGVAGEAKQGGSGRRLSIDIGDLAAELGFATDLLDARSAGLHIGGSINGYDPGKYFVTAAGVVRGGVDPAPAAHDLVPEVRATPVLADHAGLEAMMRLGGTVASRVAEWMAGVETMTVRLTMFYQDVTATPYDIWECQPGDGSWVCVERSWELNVSPLKRLLGHDRSFAVSSEVRRREFLRVIEGLSHRAASTIRRDAETLATWRAEHEPGPCR